MNIIEAEKRVIFLRVTGGLLVLLSLLFIFTAILKGFYFVAREDVSPFRGLTSQLSQGVGYLYHNVFFLPWLWALVPAISFKTLNDAGSLLFIIYVLVLAYGRLLISQSFYLSKRITSTKEAFREREWFRELEKERGVVNVKETMQELKINIAFPNEKEWYKKPVGIVSLAVAAAVIAQILNLTLGFTS